jgi:hypothetical protein
VLTKISQLEEGCWYALVRYESGVAGAQLAQWLGDCFMDDDSDVEFYPGEFDYFVKQK